MISPDHSSVGTKPLVSIILSAYNAEKYIDQTLRSVLTQTWQPLEIIVVNDGSTDNTGRIVESYKDKGVKLITKQNEGQDAALNEGFRQSAGSFIKFMDSDDLINPEMIEKQLLVLNNSEAYVAYGEWARFFNNNPQAADFTKLAYWKDMDPLDFLTAMPNGVMLQCGIMLIPRKLIEKAGLWNEKLILFNDTEFFTRILLASEGVKFSAGAKLYYRSGMIGSISAGRARKFYESTYLATNLIADRMLQQEDSLRVRRLISNTFLMQYYHMYPRYPDLIKLHEEKIAFYGAGTYKIGGGRLFNFLSSLFGWKLAKKIQSYFYNAGYLRLLYWMRQRSAEK